MLHERQRPAKGDIALIGVDALVTLIKEDSKTISFSPKHSSLRPW